MTRLQAIRELHSHHNEWGFCFACGRTGPCKTYRLTNGGKS